MTTSERAAKHAALADLTRLEIVDLLTLGDLSPSELQARLGIPSNLLAHHLGLLEREGIIDRHRSEADRRRSYVRLVPHSLDGLAPATTAPPRRIVFVCTANSTRSPLAEALWKQASGIPVASAGTHPSVTVEPGAITAARRHGLSLAEHAPRHLDEVLQDDDYIITVCDTAHEELPAKPGLHWSIPDPVRVGTDAAFDAAFEEIARRVGALVPHLNVR